MILQFSLTVPEAKAVIAKAAASLPEVKKAFESGRIFLKGGTTVSALAEELVGIKLGICGRISPLGTKGPRNMKLDAPHSIVIENGEVRNVDDIEEEEVLKLGREDVFVISANAIDINGNAAMMAGTALGGTPGKILGGLMAEGFQILILAGLEKLIPIDISSAVKACGRKKIDISFGMAVGLIPIIGKLITEQIAIESIAEVKCTVIGKGGICGAEGSTTLVAEGDKKEVKKIYDLIKNIKGSIHSGSEKSMMECVKSGPGCGDDLACIYKKGSLLIFD
ncbi:MAG: hypothetical protein AB1420_16900 [Bacillota bacterium]